MKIRNGFVSNSSSGSFILNWRVKAFGEIVNIERAVGDVFEVSFNEEDKIDWENTWNKEAKDKVDEVIKYTVMNNNGTFTSAFHTSMVNSAEDFGEAAKSLVMGIVVGSEKFEIIDSKIEMDY